MRLGYDPEYNRAAVIVLLWAIAIVLIAVGSYVQH